MPEVAPCPVDDCKLTVDVVLKSSDGEFFGAHQRNLTDEFLSLIAVSFLDLSDPVSLEESAEVLGLVLRFMHNIRTPTLDTISLTLLVPLADAVEKYRMYLPMDICRRQMMNAMDTHPNEVFFYSVKHNYSDLADKTAKLTLNNSARVFVDLIRKAGFDDGIAVQWVCYRDGWMEVLVQLSDYGPPKCYGCSESTRWLPFKSSVLAKLSNPGALDRFSEIVHEVEPIPTPSSLCKDEKDDWISEVRAKVAILPKYSEL